MRQSYFCCENYDGSQILYTDCRDRIWPDAYRLGTTAFMTIDELMARVRADEEFGQLVTVDIEGLEYETEEG